MKYDPPTAFLWVSNPQFEKARDLSGGKAVLVGPAWNLEYLGGLRLIGRQLYSGGLMQPSMQRVQRNTAKIKGRPTVIPREEKAQPAKAPAAPAAVFTKFAWPGPFCPGEPIEANNWLCSPTVSGCHASQYQVLLYKTEVHNNGVPSRRRVLPASS